MKIKPFRLIGVLLLLIIAISILGGSAIWAALGLNNTLEIEGRSTPVRSDIGDIGEGWKSYGGDKGGNRYVNVDMLNRDNVSQLEIAWTHRTGALDGIGDLRNDTAFEATPILVEDSLIFCTPFNQVIAVDPGTGAEKWRYDALVSKDRDPANLFNCRGVSYWNDSPGEEEACQSRIFMGTVDARLIAIDAKTGKPCDGFGDGGQVQIEPDIALRWPGEMQISSAPAIIGNAVVTGTSISDNLRAQAPAGTVFAFNARTGAPAWTFNPVPRDPDDPARASWEGESADRTGHANVWSTMAVDEARGLVFLPTSSASPDFFGGERAGDNNYASSVVALDGQTGDVVWHFQTVHHDVWDYDVPAQPGLYQVWRDGKAHDVVSIVTKTGLVFVLDRDTGEPFLPIEERAVPQNPVDGEVLSPTQPFPVNTPPVVPNILDPNDAFGVTLWDKRACAAKLNALRHEGLFTPVSEQGTLLYPFTGGGANWGGSAYDPTRNLMIINMNSAGHAVALHKEINRKSDLEAPGHADEFAPMEGTPYGMTRTLVASPLGLPCVPPPWGILAGVDLDSGEIVWRKPLGTTRDLAPGGISLKFGVPNFGGPIVTAGGLTFIAATMDNYLRAFDSETGEELWKGRLPAGGQATPMGYSWEGRQYVVIAAGGHGMSGTTLGDYLVAFALPE